MKAFAIPLILMLLIVCVVFVQAKATTPSQSFKNETNSKPSKNETRENLTISLDYELVPIAAKSHPVGAAGAPPVGAPGAPPVGAPEAVKAESCTQKDIDALKKKSAYVAKRYSDKELDDLCQRQLQWKNVVTSMRKAQGIPGAHGPFAMAAPPGPPLTANQSSFINGVRSCKGKECFESSFRSVKPTTGHQQPEPVESSGNRTGGLPAPPPPSVIESAPYSRVTRKEYRTLTEEERKAFHAALNAVKTKEIDGVSRYNLLVEYHAPAASPSAHWGCAFLPWHREFLKQLEIILRFEDPNVFLPYWDSTLDKGLPDPCDSIFFSDPFMGPSKGHVNRGDFSQWKTARSLDGTNDLTITRECGGGGELFDPQDIDYYMTKKAYKDLCNCNDPAFESAHGLVHVFVGGHMGRVPLSPNDPIFFMHHCFIDYIWEQWRLKNQNRDDRENHYPTGSETCGEDYNADVPMKPFPNKVNKDGMANWYTDELYQYALRPMCPDTCSGPNLFCSKKFTPPRCLSKVKLGGNCKGFEEEDSCYNGKCVYGECKAQ